MRGWSRGTAQLWGTNMADVGWQKRGKSIVNLSTKTQVRPGLDSYCCAIFVRIIYFPSIESENKMVISCAAFGCENRWKLKKDLAPSEKNLAFHR